MARSRAQAGGKQSGGQVKVRRRLRVRSGDRVRVMAGKDRGKTGRVLRVEPAKERVYVEGLNMIKKHTRPKQVPSAGAFGGASSSVGGGVIELEGPIHACNLLGYPSPNRLRPCIWHDEAQFAQAARLPSLTHRPHSVSSCHCTPHDRNA